MIASNPVKARLREGGVSLGSFCLEFRTPGIGRLAAAAGAEFLIYDMEHSGWSTETIAWLAATSGSELVPVVRVPSIEANSIAPVLDSGAAGIMVPMVEDAAQARAIVAAATYPPAGRRGSAFGLAAGGYVPPVDAAEEMRAADSETLLIAQIETVAGLERLDEIAAIDGIDVLWVGQADLTASLGKPGSYEDPEFLDALARVAEAAERNGKAAAYLALSVDEGRRMLALGYRMIAYGADLWLYQSALRDGLARLRDEVK